MTVHALYSHYIEPTRSESGVRTPPQRPTLAPQNSPADTVDFSREAQDVLDVLVRVPGNDREAALALIVHFLGQDFISTDAPKANAALQSRVETPVAVSQMAAYLDGQSTVPTAHQLDLQG